MVFSVDLEIGERREAPDLSIQGEGTLATYSAALTLTSEPISLSS